MYLSKPVSGALVGVGGSDFIGYKDESYRDPSSGLTYTWMGEFRNQSNIYGTPEITKVKFHLKMPLEIHW